MKLSVVVVLAIVVTVATACTKSWKEPLIARSLESPPAESNSRDMELDLDSEENTNEWGRESELKFLKNTLRDRESELKFWESTGTDEESNFDSGENTDRKGRVFKFYKDNGRTKWLNPGEMPLREDEPDFDLGENTAQDRDPEFWKNNERDTNTALDILGRNDNFLIGH